MLCKMKKKPFWILVSYNLTSSLRKDSSIKIEMVIQYIFPYSMPKQEFPIT